MAAPSIRAVTTVRELDGPAIISQPSHQAGDILVVDFCWDGGEFSDLGWVTPSDWAIILNHNASFNGGKLLMWKRTSGSEGALPIVYNGSAGANVSITSIQGVPGGAVPSYNTTGGVFDKDIVPIKEQASASPAPNWTPNGDAIALSPSILLLAFISVWDQHVGFSVGGGWSVALDSPLGQDSDALGNISIQRSFEEPGFVPAYTGSWSSGFSWVSMVLGFPGGESDPDPDPDPDPEDKVPYSRVNSTAGFLGYRGR